MNKRIKKQFWLSPEDDAELKRKAKLCNLPQTTVIRMLIRGLVPREQPDARFYEAMQGMTAIGNNLNQLAAKASALGFVDAPMLKKEAIQWARFQTDIERRFLRPDKSNLEWK